MNMAAAFILLKIKLYLLVKTYRETGFVAALIDAKELANELEVESIFQQKRCYKKKKMFLYESSDEPILDPKTEFRVNFFQSSCRQSIAISSTTVYAAERTP